MRIVVSTPDRCRVSEITEAPNAPGLVGAYAVIWTTTPWTIPSEPSFGLWARHRLPDGAFPKTE